MDRATIHHLHDELTRISTHMCWEFYFKAWNIFLCFTYLFCFCFYFILFFEWLKLTIFIIFLDTIWKDMSDDLLGYNGTSPHALMKLSRSAILADFFCMQCIIERMHLREFKHAMMWNEKLCKNINYHICKCRNGLLPHNSWWGLEFSRPERTIHTLGLVVVTRWRRWWRCFVPPKA